LDIYLSNLYFEQGPLPLLAVARTVHRDQR
jgi:hypothetical protein